jgi:ribonuclease HI
MSKNNYYAVAKGRKPGIYQDWFGPNGAEDQVRGYSGARFKGFATLEDAKEWLNAETSNDGQKVSKPNFQKSEEVVQTSYIPAPPPTDDQEKMVIFTDGGCIGNPGPGGYGVVVLYQGNRKELSGGYRLTTNNRMELMACIVALQTLDVKSSVVIYSDSQYVVNGISLGWAKKWRANGWKRNKKDRAENPDLWEQLLDLCVLHQVEFKWVRGHVGNRENERCDQLSMQAAMKSDLPVDSVYESAYN